MVLPLLKLGTLALRTISKPLAAKLGSTQGSGISSSALRRFCGGSLSCRRSRVLRDLFPGYDRHEHKNHRLTTTMQRRIYSHATDAKIRPLNEERAVQAAADLIGELFVFSVAVAALIFEVQRNVRSEARKEEARKQELESLRRKDEELARDIELLQQKYAELEQLAKGRGLAGIIKFKPAHSEAAKSSTTTKEIS